MFANFIYFIIVLLIYSTYQPPEQTNFDPWETLFLFFCLIFLFAAFTRFQFHKLEKQIYQKGFSVVAYRFDGIITRHCVIAILLFGINIYGLNLPSFLIAIPVFSTLPTVTALFFLGIFIFYLSIVWALAHKSYRMIYKTENSWQSYVWSNISFSIPVLLPWLFLSGILDLINLLPFESLKQLLATTEGQVGYFLIFLLIIAIIGPAIIQKFWRCKPLESGYNRSRIELLCKKAGLKYADILYWPAFGSRMITAGVMGLIKKFRYILITGPLIRFLDPDEIDAVVAHEIGHIKRKHLIFYLVFFSGYMLLSYSTYDLIIYLILFTEPVLKFTTAMGLNWTTVISTLFSITEISMFLIYFRYVFGYFMRNFERQADCYVYTLFDTAKPLISTFNKIIATSGQSPDRPNWHHFSIKERIDYLNRCEADKNYIFRHDRKIQKSMGIYFAAIILVGAIGYSLNFGAAGKELSNHVIEKIIFRELDKSPDDPILYQTLGDIYYNAKNYHGVQQAYEKSLILNPDNPHVLNNLAWLYATCDDLSYRNSTRALKLSQKAVALLNAPHTLDTLAESYFVNGKYEKAIATELRALEQVKTNRSHYKNQLDKFRKATNTIE
ncbi:MAG: M48 family metalloprotease [Thermodesulfobacteriota bacterium]|nr:M48 family metalloprotease [Thermodesulfobacteriota bacterium]